MNRLIRGMLLVFVAILVTVTPAFAYSGFPGAYYPGNQYGMNARYYSGPWGETMVYGAHGYFPNWNGYPPYGYRSYGHVYTVWDLHYGRTSWR